MQDDTGCLVDEMPSNLTPIPNRIWLYLFNGNIHPRRHDMSFNTYTMHCTMKLT